MLKFVKLCDETSLITKGTTPTTIGKNFVEKGIPFLRAQNIINGEVLIDSDILFIDAETHNNDLRRSQIQEGDLLITIAGTIGRTAIVRNCYNGLNCNQAVAIIRLNSTKIDIEFLRRFIETDNAQRQFNKSKVTATISNLSLEQVGLLKIPFFPLPTQKKIAAILDAADEYRQKTKTLIEKYDQLAQSVFLEMFGDPVRNEKGWEKIEMRKLCSFQKESILPDKIVNGTNYIGLESIEKETGIILEIIKVNSGELKSNKFIFDDNYILYGKLRPYLNKVALPFFKGICSTDIIPIKPINGKSNRQFISQIMKSKGFVTFATERSSGANLPRISPNEIEKYLIINPPIAIQNQFAERLKLIEAQKQQAQACLQKAEALFQSLLQRAFKGELVEG